MNITPIIVMMVILLVITIVLFIAEKFLVNYGECKISVKDGDKESSFTVEGGDNLLTCLGAENIDVSSSCGGKGSCGYCKVKLISGGGELLPTEEIYMSRKEINEGMHLACQVKVKNDIDILIPDFLEVVREMVIKRKFDVKKNWMVKID